MKRVTTADKEKMKKLREEGLTYRAIAQKFKIGIKTIYYHLNPLFRKNLLNKNNMKRRMKNHE